MIEDEKLKLIFTELIVHYPFLDLPMISHRALPDYASPLYDAASVTPRRMQNVRLHLVNAYRQLFAKQFTLSQLFDTSPVTTQEFVGFVLLMGSYGYSIPLMIGQMAHDVATQVEWMRIKSAAGRFQKADMDTAYERYARLVALDSWFGQEIAPSLRAQWPHWAQHVYPYVNLTGKELI